MKKPGKSDPSRRREEGYDYKRDFYPSAQVAEDYDFHRFSSPERQKRNARKWAAIRKALAFATGVHTILDLPCGTGLEMLQKASSLDIGRTSDGKQPAIRAGHARAHTGS